ncbi:MAG: ribonuclease HI family protein [Candidatus Gribaldobacteria bacterium]|nr:ribonuclease HI family protein [Candidatus Gribaldobacteria bacterium]
MQQLTMYTDGGSRGNPGPSAIGVVFFKDGQKIKGFSQYLGEKTNNEAEYEALIFGFKKAKALLGKGVLKSTALEVRSDSELLVRQMNGQYKIQEPHIQQLFLEVWNLKTDFGEVKIIAIPRELNKEADKLVNEALDAQNQHKTLF